MNNIPDSERMLLDFDGWLGSQPEDRQAQIRDYVDSTPDPVGAKKTIASRFAVAESTGIDPVELDDKWDVYRGGFAAEKGGDWLAGVNDDNAFHTRLVQEAQFRRDERQILRGPDDDKAEGAAEKSKSALVAKMSDAAFTGAPFAESFAGWQETVRSSPGWRADRSTVHETVAREVYDKTAAVVAKVKPIADEAFAKLAADRGVGDGPADFMPFELFRGLSAEEKGAAYRLISEKAKTLKSDKSRTQAFGEGIGRGFENLAMGAALNPLAMSFLYSRKFAEGDPYLGEDPLAYFGGGGDARKPEYEAGIKGMLGMPRKMTAAEADALNAKKDALGEDVKTAQTLRRIAMGEIDPTDKAGGYLFQKAVMPVADSTALIAGMMTSGGATLFAATGQYTNEQFQRLTDAGMDDAEALKIAADTGAAQAALDKLGFEVLRGVPAVNRALNRLAMGGSITTRAALATVGTGLAEPTIETLQDTIIPALVQDMYATNPKFDVNWPDVWREAANRFPETMLGMLLLSGAGGAYQTFSDTQATRMLSESKAAMTLAGYTDAQIELIQQQPIAERGRLLAEFAPEKAPTGAEKDALIERYTKAATAERDAAIAKIQAETGEASDALDYAVRVTRRQGSGWTVTTESGKSLVVDTAEAARRIRQDLAQASSAAEAETLVRLVEEWHGADTNAERETTFTGETAISDGNSITYTRGGNVTREITDARTLETLRREAEIVATQTANEAVNVLVNGSNVTFQRKVADAAYQVVQRLEINRSSSSVLTFLHESMESNWRAGMQNGTLTREATQRAVASIAGAFNLNSNDAETRAFAERVKRVADGIADNDELRETVSELATADVIGRRKSGGKVEVGSISRAISDAIQRAADESTIKGLTKLQGFIRAAKAFFRGVLGTVAAIRKAKQKNGKLAEDWEAFMHKITGTSVQTEYDAGRVEDLNAQLAAANAASETYVPPNAEPEAAGIAFSLSEARMDGAKWKLPLVRLTREQMIARGADGSFSGAYEATIPISKIIGREPSPAAAEGEPYTKGREIKVPVEAAHDPEQGGFVLYGGNHRVTQAELNGDETIPAFVAVGMTFSASRAKPADTSNVIVAKDGTVLVGPTTFSISAYHGTPHKVDKFSTAKIGTGEGAQAYGWGLYFAEEKAVAEEYRKNLAKSRNEDAEVERAFELAAEINEKMRDPRLRVDSPEFRALQEQYKKAQEIAESIEPANRGNTYTVELDVEPDELLDWDKPLSEQSEKVKKAFGEKLPNGERASASTTGERLYRSFAEGAGGDYAKGSSRLNALGIPGIRYLDGASRGDGRGTSNFVIFDESRIKIVAENDKAIAFSVSPSAHVELLQRQVDAQLSRDPDRRRGFGKAAKDKLEALEFNWTTDRVNERGVKTRALVEQRSPRSLDKEQAFREAMRREELEAEVYAVYGDVLENESLGQLWGSGPVMEYLANPTDKLHGRLMSKSAAVNSGKLGETNGDYGGIDGVPRVVFGGSLMPDQVAQELFEAGVLRDASADALWDAIRSEVKSAERWKKFVATAKEDLKQAKRQAREEMAEWRREQDELQAEDWNPKARLLRDMRALDAVLSVMPPELRSKVGGFIKLAELTTDKARMNEIEKRIKKLGGLVEEYLQKENVEALDRLIEKATPATGAGEKPKGKIGVEGHRVFTAVEAVRGMTVEQVDAERARLETAIEDRIAKGEDVIDLLEQEQILEMFGAFDEKTAAEMDRAVTWLDGVYRTGKNAWRMAEEMRLAELATLKAETIKAVGIASKSGTQEQKANAATLKKFAESAGFQLLSFTQVVESVLGEGHPLAKRWSRAAREATNQRTDAILGANARFERAAREAFGGVSKLEMSKRLWDMTNDFRIELPVVEGGGSETLTVPIATIKKWKSGELNPADLGYSKAEADELIEQLESLPEKTRKKNLSIERTRAGETRPAKYTEAQAISLTMLAMQEQYLPNLKKHGYTADVLEAAEASLSDAAKSIRSHLLKEYKDGYTPLAKVFREMFGIDLPSVANYSPAAFMHAGETRDVDPFGGMVAEGGFRAGFLKSRKEHLAAPRIENAFQTYLGHVAQTEHWRAFAPLVRELRGVFGSVEVKDSILSNRGAGLASATQEWITALEQNGLASRFNTPFDRWARAITGTQAKLTLAWKLGTLIKQSLAAISAASRLPSGAWTRGMLRVLGGKVDVAAIRNSPMIQRRIESGFSPEVRAAMASLFNGKPSVWSQFVQSGMEKIGEVDAFFTSIGTAIAYDYHYNEGLKSGMSEESARAMALVEAEDNLARTAQPSENIDRSLFELSLPPIARPLFMFASNARKDVALILSALMQMKRGNITKAQFAQTLAVSWFAVGFGSAILSAWWRDSNDDDDNEFLDIENWNPVDIAITATTGPLSGVPIVSSAYNTMKGYGPNDPFKPLSQGESALLKIGDGDKSEPVEKTIRRAVDVANGVGTLIPKLEALGIGGNIIEQAFNLVDNFTPDTESEAAKKEKAALAKERKAMKEE